MQLLMSSIAFALQKQAYLCFKFAANHKPFVCHLCQQIGDHLKSAFNLEFSDSFASPKGVYSPKGQNYY